MHVTRRDRQVIWSIVNSWPVESRASFEKIDFSTPIQCVLVEQQSELYFSYMYTYQFASVGGSIFYDFVKPRQNDLFCDERDDPGWLT